MGHLMTFEEVKRHKGKSVWAEIPIPGDMGPLLVKCVVKSVTNDSFVLREESDGSSMGGYYISRYGYNVISMDGGRVWTDKPTKDDMAHAPDWEERGAAIVRSIRHEIEALNNELNGG